MTTTRSAICATTAMSWVMNSTAAPVSRLSRSISARISAWMVTSSAVVGSSAISSRGSQASAMAIITRWRMPPDSSCGYWPSRRSGSGMRTWRRRSSARVARRLAAQAPVDAQALGQLPADGEDRVQRRHRLLEDHADLVAADGAHQIVVGAAQLDPLAAAVEEQAAAGDLAAAELDEPHQAQRRHRLARPALADEAHGLARRDGEADVLDPHHRAVLGLELDAEVPDLGDRMRMVEHSGGSP